MQPQYIHTDHGPAQGDIAAKVHVARDSQMIELDDLRDLLEPLLELRDFLEVVPELDDGRRREHAVLVEDELAVLERVDVTLDQQQIRAALHGQEAAARHVDTVAVLEVPDRCSGSGLELMSRVE